MAPPTEACDLVHTTAADGTDTCESITGRYNLPVSLLADLNPALNMTTLCADMQLPPNIRICVHNITMDEYQCVDVEW